MHLLEWVVKFTDWFVYFQVSLSAIKKWWSLLGGEKTVEENMKKIKSLAAESVAQFLELIQALNFSHGLTQSHSLQFAKKESLDLVHWIILSDHCSIHLRPWNHNQFTRYSHQYSPGITRSGACVYRQSVIPCTLDLCVVLCLVLLVFDGQLHSIPRQIDFLSTWILEGKEEEAL